MNAQTVKTALPVFPLEEAVAFFATIYGGEHNIPGKLKEWGLGWKLSHPGELATFDSDKLTALVLLAHDRAIRVSIMQGGPRRLAIVLFKRQAAGKSMSERHPTIAQALITWRSLNVLPPSAPQLDVANATPLALPSKPWREVLDMVGDTATSAVVDRQFARLSAGWREDHPRYLELAAARVQAKHELCFEHDQSNWGG
jgi:hypothetical protein